MIEHDIERWQHAHDYAMDVRHSEKRTYIVIALTALTMIVEITAGLLTNSMALLADGWHMSTHLAALSIAAAAYYFTRKYSKDRSFTFGTGKISSLGGFASAVFLVIVAALMIFESIQRFFEPRGIHFNEAILVAIIGLVVNIASAWILGGGAKHKKSDHNLRAAYLHVLTDALTSLTAIAALLTGKYLGLAWMDPAMGIVGGIIIIIWAQGLIRDTARILLDRKPDSQVQEQVKEILNSQADTEVADIHVWNIGQDNLVAVVSVVTHSDYKPEYYKSLLKDVTRLKHVTIEVNHCQAGECK